MVGSLREGYGIAPPMHDPHSAPPGRPFTRLVPLLLPLLLLGVAQPVAAEEKPTLLQPEGDGITVTGPTRLASGTYRIRDENDDGVLRITRDGVSLDLGRATLIGAPEDADPNTFSRGGDRRGGRAERDDPGRSDPGLQGRRARPQRAGPHHCRGGRLGQLPPAPRQHARARGPHRLALAA